MPRLRRCSRNLAVIVSRWAGPAFTSAVARAQVHWALLEPDHRALGVCAASLRGRTLVLEAAALLPEARGQGLQRRMIRRRLAWGREHGARVAVTYTLLDNVSSIKNLLACGFNFYRPRRPWAGEGVHYFRRNYPPCPRTRKRPPGRPRKRPPKRSTRRSRKRS